MKNVIIGTAGHVDHGKTLLIKALTNIDTDRLKEEKKRGITIENGYAYLLNDKGYHLGIIDVPGHEKFVKNMLAGIGGIDIVLLIISLEEGIKPQTIEHFEIVKSLGIKKGIIVFTKLDSKNVMDFNVLKEQVKGLTKDSFLQDSKMICVSSLNGTNIDVLKDEIFRLVDEIGDKKYEKNITRLPIDRVFTMDGFGTVVTGTLMEGKIDTGDELMLYPSMKIVKVRKIESHSETVASAFAGQRTAINLLNVKKEEIERGDILAYKSSIAPTDMIDCKVVMFKSRSRDLKNNEKVLFNFGARQITAQIKFYSKDNLYIQLKFDEKIPIKRNDKFIIRFTTPIETCGGGIVLNVETKKYKTFDDTISHFKNIDSNDDKIVLCEIVNTLSSEFYTASEYAKRLNVDIDAFNNILNAALKDESIRIIQNEKKLNNDSNYYDKEIIVSNKFYDGIVRYVNDILSKFHKENKMSKGMKKEELKSILFKRYNKIGDTILENILVDLGKKNIVKIDEDVVSSSDFKVVVDSKKEKEINIITDMYKKAKFEPPLTQDVVDAYAKGKAPALKLEARQIIVDLAKSGKLEKLTNDYYIDKKYYDIAVETVIKLFENKEKIQMKDLRDALNTSRKYAILLCDHFDQKKITKTVGDYRILIWKQI